MNTRVQVEHPVTELVTGLDLVLLQIAIASGERLPFSQGDLSPRGWALELRVTAEDPFQNFLPTAGVVSVYRPPEGPGVRHDGGVFQGQRVSSHYDPLIAKLILSGRSRSECIARAKRAIREYRIEGISSTLPFFERLLSDPRFVSGDIDVGYVDRNWMEEMASRDLGSTELIEAALAAAAAAAAAAEEREPPAGSAESASPWKLAGLRESLRVR
jgi:acetyl/propionyl-CoA carboxylase alpha subunit